ncbi:hypothetical protein AMELA_G00226430 [Ameiurus melas]|uniref:Uncharacterized protein n=1 Tax=Ameiurus melas TaxID=219545 RepID=A0A7J5ZZM8_AMEME|nr:hypothetical protein AMELA_G00226430 [Ameiurus melas]
MAAGDVTQVTARARASRGFKAELGRNSLKFLTDTKLGVVSLRASLTSRLWVQARRTDRVPNASFSICSALVSALLFF